MSRKTNLITRSNDPDCVHFERIVDLIGTCRCGQVRTYRDPDDFSVISLESARRGGKLGRGRPRKGILVNV